VCRRRERTFSLLPYQLIPYVQYTMAAVVRTLLTVLEFQQRGRQGFYGATLTVDPDSSVTPWLVCCWLAVILKGLRRAHPVLGSRYDLSGIRSGVDSGSVALELRGYLKAFGLWPPGQAGALVTVVIRYSRPSGSFLFGTPSQLRRPGPT
jgi:hypothetical protein